MIAVLVGVAVFALQVIAYRYISRKVQTRRAYKRRLASLVYEQPAPRVAPRTAHNRPGDN